MYESFFGLKCEPFSVAPDPRFLFMSDKHREALAHLMYGLHRGAGFVLLTGEIGAGKTTVWRHFLENLPPHFDVANVVNPRLGAQTLLARVCEDLAIEPPAADADLIDVIHGHLLLAAARGRRTLIVVDEAQAMSNDVLEQLRLLTNLDTSGGKLQVLLIGQPELRAMLQRPELEPLAQRVVARFHLAALPEAETFRYVAHRLAVAGSPGPMPFTEEALKRVHELCRGVPRRINVLCDRALLAAQTANEHRVDRALVDRAASDVFDQPDATPQAETRAAPRPLSGAHLLVGGAAVLATAAGLVLFGPAALRAFSSDRPGANAAMPSGATVAKAAPASVTASAPAPAAARALPIAAAPAPRVMPVTTTPPAPARAEPSAPPTAAPVPVDAAAALDAAFAAGTVDEAQAWRSLAGLWGVSLPAGDPCAVAIQQALHCYRARGGLVPIRQLSRPGLIRLADARGRVTHVLLTGLGSDSATLRFAGADHTVPLPQLAQAWRGEFATFWRAPPGYRPGDLVTAGGPLGAWMGQQLATVDGKPATVADNDALHSRVFAFQLAQGLPPDGLAGPLTLMLINRASGVDEPRLAAAR